RTAPVPLPVLHEKDFPRHAGGVDRVGAGVQRRPHQFDIGRPQSAVPPPNPPRAALAHFFGAVPGCPVVPAVPAVEPTPDPFSFSFSAASLSFAASLASSSSVLPAALPFAA